MIVSNMLVVAIILPLVVYLAVAFNLTLVVCLAVKKRRYLRVKPPVRSRKKNRGDGVVVGRYNVRTMTREQKYVYKKYFTSGALTFGKIKDDKYLALVQQELQKRNVRRRALEHLGIAPEQVAEAGELSYVEVLESPWLSASISKTTTPRLLSSMAAKSCFSPVSAQPLHVTTTGAGFSAAAVLGLKTVAWM